MTPPVRVSRRGLIIHEPILDRRGVWHGRWAHRLHVEVFPRWLWLLVAAAVVVGVPVVNPL